MARLIILTLNVDLTSSSGMGSSGDVSFCKRQTYVPVALLWMSVKMSSVPLW